MCRLILRAVGFTAFILMFTSFIAGAQPLSGSYTIGGPSPDYGSINGAVSDLNTLGISGPVEFLIRDGSYIEKFKINEIVGASETSTITFRSESGNRDNVIIDHVHTNSGDNVDYTVFLNGTDHIRFIGLTIASLPSPQSSWFYNRVVVIKNLCSDVIFENNVIKTTINVSGESLIEIAASAVGNGHITFRNNHIIGGEEGIDLTGGSSAGSYTCDHIVIEGNFFESQNYYVLRLNSIKNLFVEQNIIRAVANSASVLMNLSSISDTLMISRNRIYLDRGYSTAMSVFNLVRGSNNYKYITNNIINMDNGDGAEYKGIATGNCCPMTIAHNTIRIEASVATSVCYKSATNDTIGLYNNIFAMYGPGICMLHNPTTVPMVESDKNVWFHEGGSSVIGNGTTGYATLADYVAVSGNDGNSLEVDPSLANDDYLIAYEPSIQNICDFITEVPIDFFGETRSVISTDPGAVESDLSPTDAGITDSNLMTDELCMGDVVPLYVTMKNYGTSTMTTARIVHGWHGVEYNTYEWSGSIVPFAEEDSILIGYYTADYFADSLNQFWVSEINGLPDGSFYNDTLDVHVKTSLTGIYTLSASGGDFSSLAELATTLSAHGVCGPVDVAVANGTYQSQAIFYAIPGTSTENRVRIYAASGDSAAVRFEYLATASNYDYVVRLSNVNNLHFDHVTVRSTGGTLNNVFQMFYGTSHIRFTNCVLWNNAVDGTSEGDIISVSGPASHYVFTHNVFRGGDKQISLSGSNQVLSVSDTIAYNRFEGTNIETAIEVVFTQGIQIVHNEFVATHSSTLCLVQYAKNGFNIAYNKIQSTSNSRIIEISLCQVLDSGEFLIANNMSVNAGTFAYISNSHHVHVYHNNVLGQGIATGSALADLVVYNNVFKQNSSNWFYNVFSTSLMVEVESDYNVFYCPDENVFLRVNFNDMDLNAWRNTYNLDQHSLVVNPNYISGTDLHIDNATALYNAALPLASIVDDYDHEPRGANPDIGADEFQIDATTLTDIALSSLNMPDTASCIVNDSLIITVVNQSLFDINSFEAEWWLFGRSQDIITVNEIIPSGDSLRLNFGHFAFNGNTPYEIDVEVRQPNGVGDDFMFNNRLSFDYMRLDFVKIYQKTTDDCATEKELYIRHIPGVDIEWSTLETDQRIFVSQPGTYNVTVTHENGCTATDSITIN